MKTKLLTIAGFILVGLGGIGMFLPIWPTTPFILCAAFCFANNPKMLAWLKRSRLFKEYIEHYENGGKISVSTVVKSLSFLWAMLIISCFLVQNPIMWSVLFLIGVGVTTHILYISKKRPTKN